MWILLLLLFVEIHRQLYNPNFWQKGKTLFTCSISSRRDKIVLFILETRLLSSKLIRELISRSVWSTWCYFWSVAFQHSTLVKTLTFEQTQQICNDIIKKIIWRFGRILQFNSVALVNYLKHLSLIWCDGYCTSPCKYLEELKSLIWMKH